MVSSAPRFCNDQTVVFKTGSSANEGTLATLPEPLQLEGFIDVSLDLALVTTPNFAGRYTTFRKVYNHLEHISGPTTFSISQILSLSNLSYER